MTSNGAVFFSPPSTPLDSLQLPENDPDPEDVAAESTSRIVKSVSASGFRACANVILMRVCLKMSCTPLYSGMLKSCLKFGNHRK